MTNRKSQEKGQGQQASARIDLIDQYHSISDDGKEIKIGMRVQYVRGKEPGKQKYLSVYRVGDSKKITRRKTDLQGKITIDFPISGNHAGKSISFYIEAENDVAKKCEISFDLTGLDPDYKKALNISDFSLELTDINIRVDGDDAIFNATGTVYNKGNAVSGVRLVLSGKNILEDKKSDQLGQAVFSGRIPITANFEMVPITLWIEGTSVKKEAVIDLKNIAEEFSNNNSKAKKRMSRKNEVADFQNHATTTGLIFFVVFVYSLFFLLIHDITYRLFIIPIVGVIIFVIIQKKLVNRPRTSKFLWVVLTTCVVVPVFLPTPFLVASITLVVSEFFYYLEESSYNINLVEKDGKKELLWEKGYNWYPKIPLWILLFVFVLNVIYLLMQTAGFNSPWIGGYSRTDVIDFGATHYPGGYIYDRIIWGVSILFSTIILFGRSFFGEVFDLIKEKHEVGNLFELVEKGFFWKEAGDIFKNFMIGKKRSL